MSKKRALLTHFFKKIDKTAASLNVESVDDILTHIPVSSDNLTRDHARELLLHVQPTVEDGDNLDASPEQKRKKIRVVAPILVSHTKIKLNWY